VELLKLRMSCHETDTNSFQLQKLQKKKHITDQLFKTRDFS